MHHAVWDLGKGKPQTRQYLGACCWPGLESQQGERHGDASEEKMMFLPGFAATICLYRLEAKWELFRKIEEAHGVTGVG